MIKLVKRKDLDVKKYDFCVENAVESRIYAFSWYLDIVADNWDVLVLDDYRAVMPLPWKRKFKIKYIAQPNFCQQLGIFSLDKITKQIQRDFIQKISKKLLKVSIQFNTEAFFEAAFFKKTNYILALNTSYQNLCKGFNKGRKHAIKVGERHNLSVKNIEIENLITIQNEHYNYQLNNKQIKRIRILSEKSLENKNGFVLGVFDQNEFLGGAFFLQSKDRITYLFSAFNKEGKTKQAASFLISNLIKKFENKRVLLDFEGGEIPNIASFFKSFGAKKEYYFLFNKSFW